MNAAQHISACDNQMFSAVNPIMGCLPHWLVFLFFPISFASPFICIDCLSCGSVHVCLWYFSLRNARSIAVVYTEDYTLTPYYLDTAALQSKQCRNNGITNHWIFDCFSRSMRLIQRSNAFVLCISLWQSIFCGQKMIGRST